MRIDHLGLAVRSLDEAVGFYREALGLVLEGTETVASEGVRVGFLPAGGPRIELLEPTGPGSAVAKHLDRRGEGIHHICFQVDDLEAAVARIQEKGGQLIEPVIREGAEGARVAFVHPRSAHGVLVELRELPGEADPEPPGPGKSAVVYVLEPPAKIWGRILTMDDRGVSMQGVDLRSFEDLLRGASSGEMGSRDMSVVFYPMRRVEKIIRDLGTDAAPSLEQQFEARVGRSFTEFCRK